MFNNPSVKIYRKHLIDSQNRLDRSVKKTERLIARFRCCQRRSDDENSEQSTNFSDNPGVENSSFTNIEVSSINMK